MLVGLPKAAQKLDGTYLKMAKIVILSAQCNKLRECQLYYRNCRRLITF